MSTKCKFEMHNCVSEGDKEACAMCIDTSFGKSEYFPVDSNEIRLKFDLYTKAGKWKSAGRFTLPGDTKPWDDNLLDKIEKAQNSVVDGVITSRRYHLVIDEVDVPNTAFFKMMIPAI